MKTGEILEDIKKCHVQILVNHENARRKEFMAYKFLENENIGESLHSLIKHNDCLDKCRESVTIMFDLIQQYSELLVKNEEKK